MTTLQAVNNFVFVIRDEVEESEFFIPEQGIEKTHYGTVQSVGSIVADKTIKQDKKIMFHKGNGFEIEHEGETYLVLEGERIIAVV